ncbi:MAG: hypothetical protein HY512_04135 [Candidatus Aenigmarchaeota archaeon]|nr:hypothetical protein [Candidatus Aenigmarchaeota archaeon]
MSKKHKSNLCNINLKERVSRAGYSIAFFIVSVYVWYVLFANKLTSGLNELILIVPFYLAFLTAYEASIGHCVLKEKISKKSGLVHLLSIVSAIVVSVILVFV